MNMSRHPERGTVAVDHFTLPMSIVMNLDQTVPVELVERLLRAVSRNNGSGLSEALHIVINEIGAEGGEVAVMRELGGPRFIASEGNSAGAPTEQEVLDFFKECWHRTDSTNHYAIMTFGTTPKRTFAAICPAQREVLGVILWSSSQEHLPGIELIRIFLHLLDCLLRLYSLAGDAREKNSRLTVKKYPKSYITGSSERITHLHNEMELLCRGNIPVLICGETGVGKEYVARLLHEWSNRANNPFVPLNCAAIPPELWEAEMFGIDKGIATGVRERNGYFEVAEGGTIFLDEIGSMPLPLQAKLLRALQDPVIRRVGGSSVKIDVRIVAAANSDLLSDVQRGCFRADLYYRIAGVVLDVPPLRERKEDIPLLVQHFLLRFTKEIGKTVKGISNEVYELFDEYAWPGNIRELEHEIQRIVYLCPDDYMVDASLVSRHIAQPSVGWSETERHPPPPTSMYLNSQLEEVEQALIRRALLYTGGNQSQAAKLLGISRNGLANKIHRFRFKL